MPNTKSKQKKVMKLSTRNTLVGMSFILPNFLGFTIFVLIPVIFSLVLSFMEWDGSNPMKFDGLDNFTKIFNDRVFKAALSQTFFFAVFTVVFSMIMALVLAMLLNNKLRGVNFFRSGIIFPDGACVVAVSAVWKAMFMQDGGPINMFLGLFLPDSALPGWQHFWRITFPMLTPSHFFVFMMLTINSFKTFDLIFALTGGGPGTSTTLLSQYIYNKSFTSWDYGAASSASIILFVIMAAITVIQFRVEKKFNDFM